MEEKIKDLNIHNLRNLLVTTFFTLGILVSIAYFGVRQVEQDTKTNLAEQLQTTLNTNKEILQVWRTETKLDAEVIAAQPKVREKIFQLLKLEKNKASAKALIASAELTWLRKHLGTISKKYGFVGFVVFTTDGKEIGALLDTPIGNNQLKDKSDFFERSLAGDTVISLPFNGEVDLPDEHGVFHINWPTMFVSTPVKDDSGIIRAVLAFRMRPEKEFSELLSINRFGESGETYLFSSEGLMLSDSRFNHNLRQVGLISKELSSHSILSIYIKDPQVNLVEGFKSPLPREDWPLTQMATSSTSGGSGVDTSPYNDYRGMPVVGAWSWLPESNMGIASEIDASEALQPLHSLRKAFYSLFGFLSLACILGIFFRSKQVIAEKEQHQKRLKNLDEKLKTQIILDNVVDAIITINDQGEIKSFNQGAQKLFQYKDSEVLGRNVKMLMPDPDHSQHDEYLRRYLTTKSPHIIGIGREVVGLKKDGTEFPMDLAVSQVNLHDRIIFTGIIRDISPRKEFEAALIEAKKLSDDANKSKSDFLANMSHEIRTPMNGILGLTHLAMNTELTPVQYDYLKKINRSSRNLLTIINDILDVSKIEAGKIDIEDIEFNLEKVLEGVADLFPEIQEKGLDIHFNIQDEVPEWLIGDPGRISQVLTNLISNAAKFTEKGQIIISLQVLEKTEEAINLEFSVKDSGIGLSQDQIDKLFKPFSQADTSTTRKFGGTGLGLTIAKKLTFLMGGDIHIESQLGKGSNFIFNVLLKPSQKENLLASKSSFENLRILVIDDSPFMRDILMAMLKSLKFEATAVSRFSEGLNELKSAMQGSSPYDLVIIDNKLPDAVGAEVCSQLKNANPENETKVILISGFSEQDILREIKTAEFHGFLHKPLTRSSLLNMIHQVLGHKEAKEKTQRTIEEPETESQDPIQGSQILLVEDNKINQLIALEFLRRAGAVVSVAENGQEALDTLSQGMVDYDIVLMDVQMPIMDGYRATREIRALPQFKNLPILAMTANASPEDREKALASGMNEHITKPINAIQLIKTLTRFVSAKSGFIPAPATNELMSDSSTKNEIKNHQTLDPIPGLDLEDGLTRVGHNEELYKKLLIEFSRNKSDVLEKVITAVQKQDMDEAGQLLHSLKGVAGNIGAKDLAELSRQLEIKVKNNNLDSEYESLMSPAKQSLDLLIKGIKHLEEKYSSEDVVAISQPLPKYDRLKPYFEKLESLMADNNMRSRDYLETVEDTFKETPIKDFLSPVKDHLNQFNFSQATAIFAKLTNELQSASEENQK